MKTGMLVATALVASIVVGGHAVAFPVHGSDLVTQAELDRFLSGETPDDAGSLSTKAKDVQAWTLPGGGYVVRTRAQVLSPVYRIVARNVAGDQIYLFDGQPDWPILMAGDGQPVTAVFLKSPDVQPMAAAEAAPGSDMAALLDGYVPVGAEALDTGFKGPQAWRLGSKVYVRTPKRFSFGYEASVFGVNSDYVYRFASEAAAAVMLGYPEIQ
jgi:hypothetical protein